MHFLLTYLGRNLFCALFPSALDEPLFYSMLTGNAEITPFSMDVARHNSFHAALPAYYTQLYRTVCPTLKCLFGNYKETHTTNLTITSVKSHEKKGTFRLLHERLWVTV